MKIARILLGLSFFVLLVSKDTAKREKLEKALERVEVLSAVDTVKIPQEELERFKSWIAYVINYSRQSRNYGLVVNKLERKLELYYCGELMGVYPIGLGPNPVDPKREVGDGCTPEGLFDICAKNPQSAFHRSLLISYPNEEDAQRGLETGLITKAEYESIIRAVKEKRVPPQHTRLGGEICIHGGPSHYDWTLGCIAISDSVIEKLFPHIKLGTPVAIVRGTKPVYILKPMH